jgi:hypothetical protein
MANRCKCCIDNPRFTQRISDDILSQEEAIERVVDLCFWGDDSYCGLLSYLSKQLVNKLLTIDFSE